MNNKNFYIAGIGASAGGLEALKEFFSHIPGKSGVAFVVVQHLHPNFKNFTADLLKPYTSLPIVSITDRMPVQTDHIYLVPEDKLAKISDHHFYIEDRSPAQLVNIAIDVFLNSLGIAVREKAIGIIFSGMGNDGSFGVKTIGEEGGLVMVQAPETAAFESMPVSAIAVDSPILVSSPAEIAQKLVKYLENPTTLQHTHIKIDLEQETDNLIFEEIIDIIASFSQVNFNSYKVNTLLRRTEKRITTYQLPSLADYRDLLQKNKEEVQALYNDFLIGVTHFFRDQEAFKALEEKVIPELCEKRREYDSIRIWVAGCCTGEEAYSIAILFEEYIQKHKIRLEYKIFATDLDDKSIEVASLGKYRSNIRLDVPARLLDKYFNKTGDFYEIKKIIRRRILFVKHDLLKDPAFIRIDLITCRNLFIYLKADVQKKMLWTFNYALKPDGYLFLGANESSDGLENMFEKVNPKWKIFKNKHTQNSRSLFSSFGNMTGYQQRVSRPTPSGGTTPTREVDENYAELLAGEYAPACVFVNEQNEVLYTNGNVERYLRFPKKRVSFNIFNMIDEKLISLFRGGIRKVSQDHQSVMFSNIVLDNGGDSYRVNIRFKAIRQLQENGKLILVEFTEAETAGQHETRALSEEYPKVSFPQKEIDDLEQELKLIKKELQFTVDELETINEELQASNEEMISSNEELQSANEELQSSNEELHTVNTELKNKIEEITSLHNDIHNLFINTEIGTIFLDSDLNIRKFTPSASEHFNIMDNDIGRPLNHLTNKFNYTTIVEDTQRVLNKLIPIEKEVQNETTGRYYLLRILPYKTEDMRIGGTVITFMDITELKAANNRLTESAQALQLRTTDLEKSEQNWSALVNNMPDLIWRVTRDSRYVFINKAVEQQFNVAASQIIGRTPYEIGIGEPLASEWVTNINKVFATTKVVSFYFEKQFPEGTKYFLAKLIPEFAPDGKIVETVLKVDHDITWLKKAEMELQEKNSELQRINEYLDHFVFMMAHDLQSPVVHLKFATDLLKQAKNMDEIGEYSTVILNAVEVLEKTLRELIKLIKIQNLETHVELLSFKTIFEEISIELEEQLKGINLITDFSNCSHIRYIRAYLASFFRNLVSNAVKYRDVNRSLQITVSTHRVNGEIILKIRDNGQGMDLNSVSDTLFKPFKRLTVEGSGVGLGLYTIKYLVEKNGGSIEVDSTPGEGSVFYIRLKEFGKA